MDSVPLASALELARWQFALTTLYHFIFVPLTLGLSFFLALMQTIGYRTKNDAWLRLTKFFGTLFVINFGIGAATGIIQEFQFGMNWSEFSRVVGDVFESFSKHPKDVKKREEFEKARVKKSDSK